MTKEKMQGNDPIVRRKSTLVAADVADEAILLDVDSGYFFQLNKTAAQIWHHAEHSLRLSDICREMGALFAVDPVVCAADISEFVMDMEERGLLIVGEGGQAV
jgi:hypothetical protein